jgi:hypothetical protein
MPLFKTDQPRQFNFTPRFYDERKEELNNRVESIKKETDNSNSDQYVPNIRGRMRARHDILYGPSAKPKKGLIGRRVVMLIYVGLVLVIIYYVIRMLSVAG